MRKCSIGVGSKINSSSLIVQKLILVGALFGAVYITSERCVWCVLVHAVCYK